MKWSLPITKETNRENGLIACSLRQFNIGLQGVRKEKFSFQTSTSVKVILVKTEASVLMVLTRIVVPVKMVIPELTVRPVSTFTNDGTLKYE